MNYVALDCEWNHPQKKSSLKKNSDGYVIHNELIQLGAVRLDENLEPADVFMSNIRPVAYKTIYPPVLKLTNIDPAELNKAPYFPQVWRNFNDWLGDDDVVYTWGGSDREVINSNLTYWQLELWEKNVVDLQHVAEGMYFDDKQNKSLEFVVDHLEISHTLEPHVAINDAIYAAKILSRVIKDKEAEEAEEGKGEYL